MKTATAFVYIFFNWLQKKFNIAFATITVRLGASKITDIDWNQHYKPKDFEDIDRADLLKELAEIHELEEEFNN